MYLVKESSKQNIKTLRRLNFKIIVVIKCSFVWDAVPSSVTMSLFSLHRELEYFYVVFIQNKKNYNVVLHFFIRHEADAPS